MPSSSVIPTRVPITCDVDDDDENDDQQQQQRYHDDDQEAAGASSSHHLPRSSSSSSTISNIPSLTVAFSSAATTGGTSYAFGLYAAALKRNLHLTQGELDSISTAFFVAGLFSWLPGLCSDRFGTRFALTTGGVTGATSLLLYWAVARQFLPIAHHGVLVAVLSALGVGTFLSCAMVTGAVFKIIVATAGPGVKGSCVGAAKGYVGLGAGLYACIFEAIRGPNTSDLDFLPMAAFLFLGCATLPGFLLLPSQATLARCTVQDEATPRHVRILYGSLATMAVLIVVNSMMNLYESSSAASLEQHHASQAASGSTNMVVSALAANDSGDNDGEDDETLAVHELLLENNNVQHSNFALGFLLLSIWLAPIATLMFLPREKRSYSADGVILLPDHDDVNDNVGDDGRRQDDDESDNIEMEASEEQRLMMMRRRNSESKEEEDPLAAMTGKNTKKAEDQLNSSASSLTSSNKHEEERGLLSVQDGDDSEHPEHHLSERSEPSEQPVEVESNLNLYEMLQTRSALLMLWTTTVLVGAGTVMTNNAGQMVESLGFPAAVTPASLALFSVAQAFGRVMTGSVSEAALNWNTHSFGIDNGIPRPFFLVVASVIGFLAHFLLGLARTQFVFVVGATLAGLAFGCVWPLMVLITGEVFGTANVGANYMFFDGFTSAAGTLLLTKVVAQDVYERHIHDSVSSSGGSAAHAPDENTCVGMGCFQNTHMIVAGLSLTCVATSLGVMYTSRHVYNKVSLHAA